MVVGVLADVFPETAALVGVFVLRGAQVNPALFEIDGDKEWRLGHVLGYRELGSRIDILIGIVGVVPVRLPINQFDRDDKHGGRGAGVGLGRVSSDDYRTILVALIGEVVGPLGQLVGGFLHGIVRV